MSATITTAVIQPANSYDLTDLATVKDELGIKTSDTSNDNFLQRGISQKSQAIANFCNRVFAVEGVVDTVTILVEPGDPPATSSNKVIQLSRWPVVVVNSLTEDGTTLTEGVDFRVDCVKGHVYRLSTDGLLLKSWHASTVVINYVGGYAKKVTQAANVPAAGPYIVTVTNSAAFVLDGGVKYSSGTALTAVTGAPAHGQYAVSAGVYTFNATDANAAVNIGYWFQKFPDDVIEAALKLMTMRYKAKSRDPALMSHSEPNIGQDSYWIGGTRNNTFTPEIDAVLQNYRVAGFA